MWIKKKYIWRHSRSDINTRIHVVLQVEVWRVYTEGGRKYSVTTVINSGMEDFAVESYGSVVAWRKLWLWLLLVDWYSSSFPSFLICIPCELVELFSFTPSPALFIYSSLFLVKFQLLCLAKTDRNSLFTLWPTMITLN